MEPGHLFRKQVKNWQTNLWSNYTKLPSLNTLNTNENIKQTDVLNSVLQAIGHQNIAGTSNIMASPLVPAGNIGAIINKIANEIPEKKEEKKFRVQAKNFAITYSRCPIEKEEMKNFLLNKFEEKRVKLIIIGREKHEDEKDEPYHLHIRVELLYTYNMKDERMLDYFSLEKNKTYHPNIQGCKNRKQWDNYIKKEDLNPLIWGTNDPYPEPDGFIRKKNDYEAWIQYKELEKLKEWKGPIKIFGIETNIGKKQRHIWIIGDSSTEKTKTIEDTFEGFKIYKPQKGSEYRFDNYEGENVIIYDDIIPKLDELIDVSNVYKTKTAVYGKTRYHPRYWPIKQERIIIVLTNIEPIYSNNEAFKSRFIIKDMRPAGKQENHEGQYEENEREILKKLIITPK